MHQRLCRAVRLRGEWAVEELPAPDAIVGFIGFGALNALATPPPLGGAGSGMGMISRGFGRCCDLYPWLHSLVPAGAIRFCLKTRPEQLRLPEALPLPPPKGRGGKKCGQSSPSFQTAPNTTTLLSNGHGGRLSTPFTGFSRRRRVSGQPFRAGQTPSHAHFSFSLFERAFLWLQPPCRSTS